MQLGTDARVPGDGTARLIGCAALKMRLVAADEKQILFEGRCPARASLLVGLAFALIAASPFWAMPSLTPARLATALVAAALSATMMAAGWPRRQRVTVRVPEGEIEAGDRAFPLSRARALSLSAIADDELTMYRVVLSLAEGEHLVLLEGDRPDVILGSLRRIVGLLRLPVERGWGLSRQSSPWLFDEDAPESVTGFARALTPSEAGVPLAAVSPVPTRRDIGVTVLVGGFLVAGLMIFEVHARLVRGDTPLVLDFVLPCVAVVSVVLVGVGILTHEVRVFGNGTLVVQSCAFGLSFRTLGIPMSKIRAVHAIGPNERGAHALIETTGGPFAIRCGDRAATDVVAAIERARRGDPRHPLALSERGRDGMPG